MRISPLAGRPADPKTLVDIPKLVSAYFLLTPDASVREQRVAFGTSGHRGSSFDSSFNESHILAITQAICLYRQKENINGPLFLGIDTHALSRPAFASALEVLAGNGVDVMISEGTDYTPTPAVSHAILSYNQGRATGLADGILITPSHNPPRDGGFKYNPPNGGPADETATTWIQNRANEFLISQLRGVNRIPFPRAMKAPTTRLHDYISAYVSDLANVVDLECIRSAGLSLAVDPLGGAGVGYWQPIADRYGLKMALMNETVDPTFRFMTVDWDGNIRMDPSSPYAMEGLIKHKDKCDIAFACDTDHDRHGIVAKSIGLMPPNHYLSVCVHYLFANRPKWGAKTGVGKTIVSSSMIDHVAKALGRGLYETPVGFKWFVDGLLSGDLGLTGEESAGASFLRLDGRPWTTDKDGMILGLLSAEITARTGRDPGELYKELTREFGSPVYERIDAPATGPQKEILKRISPAQVSAKELAGDPIQKILSTAPGNGQAIGGVKVITEYGWFAARPSGTEEIYKIYAESFRDEAHLRRIQEEAQAIVSAALTQVAV